MARFPLADLDEQLGDFAAAFPRATADERGRAFVDADTGARLVVPFVLALARTGESPLDYASRVPRTTGTYAIVLLQAGAMAVGRFDGEECVRHKAQKRYVVRGNGKAQATHLRTRGKSRYGSRLRLQNWQRLLAETVERLRAWDEELGPAQQVFGAMGPRTAAALFAMEPPPPFARDGVRRVPRHVHVPDFEELLAVQRWLCSGRLELPGRGDSAAPDPRVT